MNIKRFAEMNEEETQPEKIPFKVVIDRRGASAYIQLRFAQDGVRLWEIMEAIDSIKDKTVVDKAFASNDIMAMCKIGHRYHMLGTVSKKTYDAYQKLKEKQKAGAVVEIPEKPTEE